MGRWVKKKNMKKIITSAGWLALGVTGLEAAYAPGLTPIESAKLMTYSITTRGFYDDNITTISKAFGKPQNTFGFDMRPSASLNLTSLPQTYIGATYTYGLRYYFDRLPHAADHSHEFNTKVEHAFSERFKLNLEESLVYAQEPEVIGDAGIVNRSPASAFRNTADISLTGQITETWGARLAYHNAWVAYTDSGTGSRSALLDRMEHEIRMEGTYQLSPKLVARSGYRLSLVNYNSSDFLRLGDTSKPSIRDQTRHTAYVGAEYKFTARLTASAEGGAEMTEFSSALNAPGTTSPYLSANLTYMYREKSYLQAGVSVDRTATDVVGPVGTGITTDVEQIAPYFAITHHLTPRMTLGAVTRYSHYSYQGGRADGETEDFLSPQLNFDYKINQFLTATATYNYDRLMSKSASSLASRGFSRNRVFVGLTAVY